MHNGVRIFALRVVKIAGWNINLATNVFFLSLHEYSRKTNITEIYEYL